jgi:hypothetical protein
MHTYFELSGADGVGGVITGGAANGGTAGANIVYVVTSITCNLIVLIDRILLTTVGI